MASLATSRGLTLFESRWLALAYHIADGLYIGELTIIAPDGGRRGFKGERAGPVAEITINRGRAIRRLATGGALGFSEAYLDGDWDSPDLAQLLYLLTLNEKAYQDAYYGKPWSRWAARLQHLFRPNSKKGSKRNILAHYDLGNSFYECWLDPSMTYSSAKFSSDRQSLEEAQLVKYAELARGIELKDGHHVLEIGCGWGGFAEFAAKEVGAKVTGITISDEQHAFAAERIQAAGLNEKVDIQLQDYRDVDTQYDRVASIEMFEAVGERYWPVYFDKLFQALKPGGIAGLQVITIAEHNFEAYRRGVDFIQRHVFPGGMLPSPSVLSEHLTRAGLQKRVETAFGLDYAKTLSVWNERFQSAWPEILKLGFDQRFKRLWEYYLAYCEAGFRSGWTDVYQLSASR